MKKTSEAGPSGLDLPKATSGVSDQTRNAGTECLLQAFIATKQRNGEAPRSKDELRHLIAGVFSWFFEGATPKKGQEGHILAKILEHVTAELNKAQPPRTPDAAAAGGAGATPDTAGTAKAKPKVPPRCQWGSGNHKARRGGTSALLDTQTHAAALALASRTPPDAPQPSPSPRAHRPTRAHLPTPHSPHPAPIQQLEN